MSATRRAFQKQAKSAADLITFLESKGLSIDDKAYAEHCLTYIGFYRLKIYMRPFEDQPAKRFLHGTTFEQIVQVYDFDRKLRLIALDAIERVEVALRSHFVNVMGMHGGPHFYYEETYFENKNAVTDLRRLGESGKHLSITHYKEQYDNPYLPAIWCLTEASSFGQLSQRYADLAVRYRKEIARGFGLHETLCVSWFRSIATFRNTCAHHGRIWNADMKVNTPKISKVYESDLANNDRCYARLVILKVILNTIDPTASASWRLNLQDLIAHKPSGVKLDAIGFPVDWETSSLWA